MTKYMFPKTGVIVGPMPGTIENVMLWIIIVAASAVLEIIDNPNGK